MYQALWRAGAVVTPATFLLGVEDLRHVIADSEACAVITTSEFVDKVADAVAGLDTVRYVICADGGERDGVIALADLDHAEPAPIVTRDDDDLAALLYTGGTTGRAKGVMLSHANLHYSGQAVQKVSHASGLNRSLMTLPLSHSYGMLVTISAMHSPERPVTVAAALVRPRRVPRSDRRAPRSDQRGRAVDDPPAAGAAARAPRPLLARVPGLRGRPAFPQGRRGDRAPDSVGDGPPGLRADRDGGTDLDQSGRPREARLGRAPDPGRRGPTSSTSTTTSYRPARPGRSAAARRR